MPYPKNPDARRRGPHFHIAPSYGQKLDQIIKLRGKGEAPVDIVELAIDQLFQKIVSPQNDTL